MAALLGLVKTDPVRSLLENYKDKTEGLTYQQLLETLRKAGAYQMIEAVCCSKVEEPNLQYDENMPCPKVIPLACTHGKEGDPEKKCSKCGTGPKLGILGIWLV